MSKNHKKTVFWRKNFYIDPDFQGHFIQAISGAALLINLILYGVNIYLFFKFNQYGESLSYENRKEFYSFFQEQIGTLNQSFLIFGACVFAGLLIYCLIISQKVAGPIFNLRRKLKEMQQIESLDELQNLTGTQFRKNDFFQDLAKDYTEAIVHIQRLQWNERKKQHSNNPAEKPEQIKKVA